MADSTSERDFFYMTLPSNASMGDFPDNKVTRYKTKLTQEIKLPGDWDVGLTEISYPQSWYNVREGELVWIVTRTSAGGEKESRHYSLPEGCYRSLRQLEKAFKRTMSDDIGGNNGVLFLLNDVSHKVTIKINQHMNHTCLIKKPLGLMLGLAPEHMERHLECNENVTGVDIVDLSRDVHSMYIYCDLVKDQIVGDTVAPLLREVPLLRDENTPESKNVVFNHIYFHPVAKHSANVLLIDIRDDTGRPVPFERGRLVVTLVLKRRYSSKFHW